MRGGAEHSDSEYSEYSDDSDRYSDHYSDRHSDGGGSAHSAQSDATFYEPHSTGAAFLDLYRQHVVGASEPLATSRPPPPGHSRSDGGGASPPPQRSGGQHRRRRTARRPPADAAAPSLAAAPAAPAASYVGFDDFMDRQRRMQEQTRQTTGRVRQAVAGARRTAGRPPHHHEVPRPPPAHTHQPRPASCDRLPPTASSAAGGSEGRCVLTRTPPRRYIAVALPLHTHTAGRAALHVGLGLGD